MAINKRFTHLNNSGSNHNLLDAYTGKVTSSFEVTGAAYFAGGLSGSLTKLVDGSDYLLAGPYITLTTNSLGQIEVSGAAPPSAVSYWDSVVNGVIYTTASMVEMAHLSASNGAEVTGSFAVSGSGVIFDFNLNSADEVVVRNDNTGDFVKLTTGSISYDNGVQPDKFEIYSGNDLNVNALGDIFITASIGNMYVGADTVFNAGLTGSLQEVSAGVPYLLAGDYITLVTNSVGQIEISASNLPGTEVYWNSYVNGVIKAENTSSMVEVPYLSASNGAEVSGSVVFAGAGGLTVGSDAVFFVSGNTGENSGFKSVFGGTVFVSGNMQVPFGTKIQSRNTGSGWVDIAQYADATGLGFGPQVLLLGDSGFNNTGIVFAGDGRPLAVITGSNEGFFSGSYKFHDGLSGSLQSLPDGSPYLISGPNITITTNSLGQIEITGSAGATSPEYWFSTGSNEIYTTGSVLIRAGLAASPVLSLVEFDISGSGFTDNVGALALGSAIKVKNVDIADAAYDYNSGSLYVLAANVGASGSGGNVSIQGGNAGWDDVNNQYGGSVALYGGTGANVEPSRTGGDIFIQAGSPGWSGGSIGAGEEGAAGLVGIYGGTISPVSQSISGSVLEMSFFKTVSFNSTLTAGDDNFFFVSGSIGSKDTTDRGVAAFGGDLVVSGNVYAEKALSVNPEGTGRGLLNFGGLDIGPITGSISTSTNAILNGNILSASAGVWNGTDAAVLRHEFHILGVGVDSGSGVQTFAATYLVMSVVSAVGIQTALSVTEVSRETSGSFASGWDVNIANDCSVEVTSSIDAGSVEWYAQRVKEMSVNTLGSRT